MTVYYVTHIRKDGPDRDRRIDKLKGYASDGREWVDDIDTIIDLVRRNWDFRTNANGLSQPIGVSTSSSDRPYLKTHANGYFNDNLEALPLF